MATLACRACNPTSAAASREKAELINVPRVVEYTVPIKNTSKSLPLVVSVTDILVTSA
ncbi:MAG TPA: hypothetical protein DEF36_01860 [Desulfotomaculum sp.]|nr:hypothetical protein [Desulfotomaculum sp.]